MEKPIALFVHHDSLLKKEADKTFAITYQSIFAIDFTEAVRVLRCKIVSCIVVDPFFNGVKRLSEIRQLRTQFEMVPLILFGKFPDPDLARICGQIGIRRCISLGAFDELLVEILAAIESHTFQPDIRIFGINPENCSRRIKKAWQLMAEEFRKNLSVEEIALRLGVHPSHLAREFQRDCGMITIKQIVIALRLHYSTFLMQNSGLKLKDIARLAGFANEYDFYRSFRKHMGITASTFRKSHTLQDFYTVYWRKGQPGI